MADDNDLASTIILGIIHRRRRRRQARRFWVHSIFTRRRQQGEYHNLLQEMRLSDPESHFRYLRMSKERFDSLLSKVKYSVSKGKKLIILKHLGGPIVES